MKILFLTIFCFSIFAAQKNCDLQLFSQITFVKQFSKVDHLNNAIKESNCQPKTIWSVFQTLRKIEGKISSSHLKRILKEDGQRNNVNISPREINLRNISSHLNRYFVENKQLSVKNINVVDSVYTIGSETNTYYEFSCHACNSTGQKNASFVYTNPINGLEKKVWVQFDLLKSDKYVIAEESLRPYSNKDFAGRVTLKGMELDKPELYLKTIDDLKYYKPNKIIKKGMPIKYSDLTPRKLVSTGKLTQVRVRKGGLIINSQAIAKQSGKHGETISLYNPQSKKQLRGKVVDFNTVVVEL